MRENTPPFGFRAAFTLLELLVSMTVLTLLILMTSQIISSASLVTTSDRKRLDADGQARVTLDRLGADIARMLQRADVDYLFSRPSGGSGEGANDRMFFYSEAPAFYDGDASTLQKRSSLALLGYRINAAWQLERLGKLLTWDGNVTSASGAGSATPGGIMFLSCPTAMLNPDPLSTLAGNWPTTIGLASDTPPYNGADDDYHVLADQVFRMEIAYLLKPVQLKDGTFQPAAYSGVPIAVPADRKNNLTATQPPAAADDDSAGYSAGSRWYDTRDSRGYVCVSNVTNAAAWQPLGMQDVGGIVVAIAVLDSTSARILPKIQVTVNNTTMVAPDMTALAGAFADLPLTGAAASRNTVPDLTLNPPRLMAEAWNNALLALTGGTSAPGALVPRKAAAQVRIYQRCFPINGN